MQRSSNPVQLPLAWDDVRLFLALYRAPTMIEAASALKVNVSTISRRLAALEETLDCVLFDRGRDGLRATSTADDLLAAAELVEHGVAEFAHAVDGLERDVSGLVRVTCPPDVADVVLLPVLRKLWRQHPQLRIALEPAEQTMDLNRREADLALRIVRPTRGDLVFTRVLTVPWRPATSRAVAKTLGEDVASWPWVGWGERFSSLPTCRWIASHAPDPILRTDSLHTHVAAARGGLGVALLPLPTIAHHRLAEVPLPAGAAEPPEDTLYLVTHRALRNVPRIRAVWDAIVDHFA